MNKAIRQALIPKDLADVLEKEVFEFYKKGLPLSEAIRVCTQIVTKYWEERYADKSGG